ncbi:MAG: hypothetical protein KDA32_15340 [Phycisphaerales bacterium]|nr:hypothetical protein [Phycisphaerales bacterium]
MTIPHFRVSLLITSFVALLLTGCSLREANISRSFPRGDSAWPWVLRGDVWTGDMRGAESGLGGDAEKWARMSPQRVWLGVYDHKTRAPERVVIRAFAYPTVEDAERAYRDNLPILPDRFDAGDQGTWTPDGVMFRWRRMVFEIFGVTTEGAAAQAAYVCGQLEERLTAELVTNPR